MSVEGFLRLTILFLNLMLPLSLLVVLHFDISGFAARVFLGLATLILNPMYVGQLSIQVTEFFKSCDGSSSGLLYFIRVE